MNRIDDDHGDELLERGLAALRAVDTEADMLQAVATRSRVMRSLEARSWRRRRSVAMATVAAILGTGTLSWAWATGRLPGLRAGADEPRPTTPVPALHADAPEAPAKAWRGPTGVRLDEAPVIEPAIAPVVEATPAPTPLPAPIDLAPPVAAPAPAAPPLAERDRHARALYRRAHDLHFRADDTAAALAAWDAYLAVAPTGRFAVEARYNRGLALVRLDRRADAIVALRPFAAGAVVPTGYRQREATALLEALGDVNGDSP